MHTIPTENSCRNRTYYCRLQNAGACYVLKCLNIYTNAIPSDISNVRSVISGLVCKLRDFCGCLDDSVLFDLKVVLNETLINAIRHGNREDVNKTVKIKAGIAAGKNLFIIIEDEGSGYDFKKICESRKSFDETAGLPDAEDCGRGIMIVRGLCDRVKVNAKGNKIVILKKIDEAH
jgi:serine/threonine-protein kinase RsbW